MTFHASSRVERQEVTIRGHDHKDRRLHGGEQSAGRRPVAGCLAIPIKGEFDVGLPKQVVLSIQKLKGHPSRRLCQQLQGSYKATAHGRHCTTSPTSNASADGGQPKMGEAAGVILPPPSVISCPTGTRI